MILVTVKVSVAYAEAIQGVDYDIVTTISESNPRILCTQDEFATLKALGFNVEVIKINSEHHILNK